MLKKFSDTGGHDSPFVVGAQVYIVLRDGAILEGYRVTDRLFDLVTLDRSPLDGSEKQGFTVKGNTLRPNWCEGRKRIVAVCASLEDAKGFAAKYQRNKGE